MVYSNKYFQRLLVFVLVSIMLAGCGGAEERKGKYLEKAKNYIEQKNYAKAKIELKNVLQIDPKHSEAYYLFGLILENNKELRKAFGNYSKAIELDENNNAARVKLGYYYMLGNAIEKANEAMEIVLKANPNDVNGRMLKAELMIRKKDVVNGIKIVSNILDENPSNTEATLLLSSIYLKQNNKEKAINVLEKGAGNAKKDITIRSQLAQIYFNRKNYEKVENLLKEIISINPDLYEHRKMLAFVYTVQNKLDDAEKVLRDAIELEPEDIKRIVQLVTFTVKTRGIKEGEQVLKSFATNNPDSMPIQFAMAEFYEKTGKENLSKNHYKKIIEEKDKDLDGLRARINLAKMLLNQGNAEEAIAYLEEVLEKNPKDNEALLLKGRYAISTGKAETAINALRIVNRDQPESILVSQLLSAAHSLNKEPQLAKEVLQRTIEASNNNPKAIINYIEYLEKEGNQDEALSHLERLLKIAPNNTDALLKKAEIMARQAKYRDVEQIYKYIIKVAPAKHIGYQKLGQFYLGQKNYLAAIKQLEKSLSRSPNLLPSLAGIVKAYILMGDLNKAEKRVEKVLDKRPDSAIAHELMAEIFLEKKSYKLAETESYKAIKIKQQWNLPYETLATIYLRQNDRKQAVKILEEGLGKVYKKDKFKILLRLAGEYQLAESFDKSRSSYEEVLKESPGNIIAANNLAAILIDNYNDDDARARAKELIKIIEPVKNMAIQDTLGWIYYRTGEIQKAIAVLENVVKSSPKVEIFNYHLGMAYYTNGNKEGAKRYLSVALESKRNFPGRSHAEKILKMSQ